MAKEKSRVNGRMNHSSRHAAFAAMAITVMLLTSNAVAQTTSNHVVRDADGRLSPAPGYLWDGDPQKTNFAVRVRPDLRVDHTDANGLVFFVPTPGFVWAGDPNTLVTKVRADLQVHHYDANGYASFMPAPAYEWVGKPDDFVTRVRSNLRLGSDGLFYPVPGYLWDGDPQKTGLAVKVRPDLTLGNDGKFYPAQGYAWVNPKTSDLDIKVRDDLRVHHYDANGYASFMPAPGYRWVGNPNDFVTEVREDVTRGSNGLFYPAPGYEWDGNPNETGLAVRVKAGLLSTANGFRPRLGYRWVNPDDPGADDFAVERHPGLILGADGTFHLATGWEWVDAKDPDNWAVWSPNAAVVESSNAGRRIYEREISGASGGSRYSGASRGPAGEPSDASRQAEKNAAFESRVGMEEAAAGRDRGDVRAAERGAIRAEAAAQASPGNAEARANARDARAAADKARAQQGGDSNRGPGSAGGGERGGNGGGHDGGGGGNSSGGNSGGGNHEGHGAGDFK